MVAKRGNHHKATWSALHEDLLNIILERLDLVDHARFSSVCKSWKSVATDNPSNKPFMLVRTDNPICLVRQLLNSYWKLWVSAKFIGSFEEWLVVQLKGDQMFLLNPTTSEAPIALPPKCLHGPDRYYGLLKVVLSAPPDDSKCCIVLKESLGLLWFCRLRDTNWTPLYYNPGVTDVMFYKDQLYTVTWMGELRVFDSTLDSIPTIISFNPNYNAFNTCLVTTFDRLLVIEVGAISKMIEVDATNSSCTEVKNNIGDNILFCSAMCSLSLSAKDYPDLQPNHMYTRYFAGDKELDSFVIGGASYRSNIIRKRCPIFFTLFTLINNVTFKQI